MKNFIITINSTLDDLKNFLTQNRIIFSDVEISHDPCRCCGPFINILANLIKADISISSEANTKCNISSQYSNRERLVLITSICNEEVITAIQYDEINQELIIICNKIKCIFAIKQFDSPFIPLQPIKLLRDWSKIDMNKGNKKDSILGWVCPKCGNVYNPNIKECWRCNKGM